MINIFANDVYQKIKKDLNKNQEIDFEDLKLKYKVSESELIGKIEEFKEKQEVYKNDKNNITYIIIFISLMILLILFVNRIKNKRIDRKYL